MKNTEKPWDVITCPIDKVSPGISVTVTAKVVRLQHSNSNYVSQRGIIADASGAIQFTEFQGKSGVTLEKDRWYRFENVVANVYQGALNLNVAQFTRITPITGNVPSFEPPKPIDLENRRTGVAPAIRVAFAKEWESRSDKVYQTGILADTTSGIRFVIWKQDTDANTKPLVCGKTYLIYYPTFTYSGNKESVTIHPDLCIELDNWEIKVPESVLQAVNSDAQTELTVTGVITEISEGSGHIFRCPVKGCGRALEKRNVCPVHDFQKAPVPDLRIKGVLCDGHAAYNLVIKRELAERIGGITLSDAWEMSRQDPLGMEAVRIKYEEMFACRYVRVKGNYWNGYLTASEVELLPYSPQASAAILLDILAAEKQIAAMQPVTETAAAAATEEAESLRGGES